MGIISQCVGFVRASFPILIIVVCGDFTCKHVVPYLSNCVSEVGSAAEIKAESEALDYQIEQAQVSMRLRHGEAFH